jgi:ABC-type nitrate/sulfonate/bicarbonate transport system substrate-binding protein
MEFKEGGIVMKKQFLRWTMVLFVVFIYGGMIHGAPLKIRMGWGIPAEEVKYVMMRRPQILKNYDKIYTLEWFQFAGTAPQATALAAGGLDAATLAALSLAESIDKIGLDVKVTGGIIMEVSPNFTSTWLVLDNSGINTVKDLKGKSIGVNVYGASLDHIQRAILRRGGLDPEKDVKILEIAFGLMEATLRRGDIQCGAFPQPFLFRAMEKGGVKPLFRLGDIQPKFVQLINVFQTKFIEKDPEVVRAFLEDWKIASRYIQQNPEEVRKITSEVTKLPLDLLSKFLLTKDDFYRDPIGEPDFETMQKNWDFFYEKAKAISKRLDVKNYYLPKFLPSAVP